MAEMSYALAEDIGDPEFFVGRKQEMEFCLKWAQGTRLLHSKSQALLSRRKMGKTALTQRLFNLLYSENNPQIVPFFFRVPERQFTTTNFGLLFYRVFMNQYLGYLRRDPELINKSRPLSKLKILAKDYPAILEDIEDLEEIAATTPDLVWDYAQSAPHRLARNQDIRVIQIIDEFQFMNRWIFADAAFRVPANLCHSYMGLAESKYAPLLVTGSYIGWLTTILNYMTARFEPGRLGCLTDEEALAAVYNYAALSGHPVTDNTATYIAEVAYNDPFYISQIIRSKCPDLNLRTEAGVRAALQFETTHGQGYVAGVWMEYIAEGVQRVNDVNGKKIVLYLARCGDEERTRDQIKADLNLSITDEELADRLHILEQADLIAQDASRFHFKGLGDPIFAAVFRKKYGPEIERITPQKIGLDFEEEMKKARRQAAWHKGQSGEYGVMYYLLAAAQRGLSVSEVI